MIPVLRRFLHWLEDGGAHQLQLQGKLLSHPRRHGNG